MDRQQVYKGMVAYLKEQKLSLDKDYFSGILKAVGWVLDGQAVKYSCDMCSMCYHDTATPDGHLDKKFVSKHVKAITKRLTESHS